MEITSFSQIALLSSFYHNHLNPSKCELQIVCSPKESLLKTLQNPQQTLGFDPFKPKLRADSLHAVVPPARALARIIYMLGVATLVAPVGVLWHTVNASVHIMTNREKAREHAYCAYTDLWVIGRVAFACLMSVAGIWLALDALRGTLKYQENTIPDRVTLFLGGISMAIMSPLYFLGGILQEKIIVASVGHKKNAVAMHFALKLHKELGLCGPHGEPLPFASDDNFYLSATGHIENNKGATSDLFRQLKTWASESENELALLAGRANLYLEEESKCEYETFFKNERFDGNSVIETFERLADSSDHKKALLELVDEMRQAHRRLNFHENLILDAASLACSNGSTDKKKWCYDHPKMYSDLKLNHELFLNPPQPQSITVAFLDNPNIPVSNQNPRRQKFDDYSFARFKAHVQYFKWCVLNEVPPPAVHTLLGLGSDYTQENLDHAYRRYAKNIHSDKTQISVNWFNCLNEIKQLLTLHEVPEELLEEPLPQTPKSASQGNFAGVD